MTLKQQRRQRVEAAFNSYVKPTLNPSIVFRDGNNGCGIYWEFDGTKYGIDFRPDIDAVVYYAKGPKDRIYKGIWRLISK
jgi:hypothetical protein